MNQAAVRRLLNPGEQNMRGFRTSTRRRRNSWWEILQLRPIRGRRNSWWENLQLRQQRARLSRERSVRKMNEQAERETRHYGSPTPTWLLREGQLPACETQVAPAVPNSAVDTHRAIYEGPNIPSVLMRSEIQTLTTYQYPTIIPLFQAGRSSSTS